MIITLLLAVISSVLLAAIIVHHLWAKHPLPVRKAKIVLFIVAHPDDETMFFAPTVIGLREQGCHIRLLCLTCGDHISGQGRRRKDELRSACLSLGIPSSNVTIVEHSRLPDNPGLTWNKRLVADIILRQILALGIDTVVSFDGYGVSGHRNHRSLHSSLQYLYGNGKLPVNTQVLVLESVNLWRKYSGVVDVLVSRWGSTYCYMNNWRYVAIVWVAMSEHRTQLVWYRYLYMLFSRYVIVNTLRRISMPKRYWKTD